MSQVEFAQPMSEDKAAGIGAQIIELKFVPEADINAFLGEVTVGDTAEGLEEPTVQQTELAQIAEPVASGTETAPSGGQPPAANKNRRVATANQDIKDLVRVYLNQAGQYKLLTTEEVKRLTQEIEAGKEAEATLAKSAEQGGNLSRERTKELKEQISAGAAAREQFITANLRLVVTIAKKHKPAEMPLLDAIQLGNIGLMRAVEKYDGRKGFKFSTYARWWIRQGITQGTPDISPAMHVPVHVRNLLSQIFRSRDDLRMTLKREPTKAELAEYVGETEEKLTEVLACATEPMSLGQPVGESGRELVEIIKDPQASSPEAEAIKSVEADKLYEMLNKALDLLEREILCRRFGVGQGSPESAEKVQEDFGLTYNQLRHIERRAMLKLRRYAANLEELPE